MRPYLRRVLQIVFVCGWGIAASPMVAAGQPDTVTRKAWGAKPAATQRMRSHRISGIMIHHTSVRQQPRISLEKKMRGLQSFSQRPGKVGRRRKPAWGDVPYHYYIGVSGRTARGRSLKYAGDTNTRYNTSGWIQIVVEGDFKSDRVRPAQLNSLRRLTARLRQRHNIPGSRISGHNDHASTDCPGPNLKKYLPMLRK
jgi:N-acetyl-anhydromuramyl-L-alanine amidase AmpD